MKLKKRIKELWVRALRSGNFKQTTHNLRSYNEDDTEIFYCCLGVLTKLCPTYLQRFRYS